MQGVIYTIKTVGSEANSPTIEEIEREAKIYNGYIDYVINCTNNDTNVLDSELKMRFDCDYVGKEGRRYLFKTGGLVKYIRDLRMGILDSLVDLRKCTLQDYQRSILDIKSIMDSDSLVLFFDMNSFEVYSLTDIPFIADGDFEFIVENVYNFHM